MALLSLIAPSLLLWSLVEGCGRPVDAAPRPANPPDKVLIAPTDPKTALEQRATFHLPPGFEIQLVAADPQLPKPMQLAFDEKGRLLVSTSQDYPLGPAPGEAPSDQVFLLEIDGKTGAATKITPFASGFNICSGVEALPGGRVILGHAPDILLLTDGDGDGVSDHSEVLYSGFARTDTHELPNSFTWGPDGWLYGLQGHVNESNVRDRRGRETAIHHGNVFRMRPDGTAIEVWARGMSNPWGLTFDRDEELFAADCESRPIWQIVAGLPYQGFLQDEEPLGFAPFITEDPHGASGFAGLASYTARAFPKEYQDCLFMASPVTGIVYRDLPEGTGSTRHLSPRPDFLTSDDPWFRPVDVELGPDGALYIADWYNRIIAHVEVPLDHPDRDKERGRIWRIVYRGTGAAGEDEKAIAAQFDGPMARDWSRLSKQTLIEALSEPGTWARRQAAAQLLHRFPEDAPKRAQKLLERADADGQARREAWWLLARTGEADLHELAGDPDPVIRAGVARALGETEADAGATLRGLLDDPDPVVVREGALALGKVPDVDSMRTLAERLQNPDATRPDDTLLRYALGFSLREHLKREPLLAEAARDGAFHGPLLPIVRATPTAPAAALLATWLGDGRIASEQRPAVLAAILQHGDATTRSAVFHPDIQMADGLADYAQALFGGGRRATRDLDTATLFDAWFPRLAGGTSPEAHRAALDMAFREKSPLGLPLARQLTGDVHSDPRTRQNAIQLLLDLDHDASTDAVIAVLRAADEPIPVRRAAAAALAARTNTPERFTALLAALAGTPNEVQLGAVESLARQTPGVNFLLDAVEGGDLHPALLNQPLVRIIIDDVHKDPTLTARQRRLVARAESEENIANARAAKTREAFTRRASHDTARGQALLEQHCLPCHRIGGIGGLRAPNLDGIGRRGIDRLLQDILQPSREIDPAFRSTLITLTDGRTEEGFVTEEDAAWLVMTDATGWETEIRQTDIAARTRLWVSPMPPDFADTLPEGDLLDIIAFLLNPPDRFVPLSEPWKATQP